MKTNWISKLLSFFGASISGVILLLFLSFLGILENDATVVFIGFIFTFISILLSHFPFEKESILFEPILFSSFGLGFVLLLVGSYSTLGQNLSYLYLLGIFILAVSFFRFKNEIQKFISYPLITIFLLASAVEWNAPWIIFPLTFINFGLFYVTITTRIPYFSQSKSSFAISFLLVQSIVFYPEFISTTQCYITFGFLVISFFYFLFQELQNTFRNQELVILCLLLVFCFLFTISTPGILICFIVLLMAYSYNLTSVQIIAVVTLFFYLTAYYYQIEIDLLKKSHLLLGTGTLHFVSYFIFKKIRKSTI